MRIVASFIFILGFFLTPGFCQSTSIWNTLYSLADGKIYMHLNNNDLIYLNFSITGFDDSSDNIENSQLVYTLASPPDNTSIVLLDGELYGFTNNATNSSWDRCGNGLLSLVKYNEELDIWEDVEGVLNFDELDDGSFLQYSSYLTSPLSSDSLYIYGGLCENTNTVSSRLLSFDLASSKFANVTTSTKPQAFFGAASVMAPDSETVLLIGGESSSAWLSMLQLATWNFLSGWSFNVASNDNSDSINSRTGALVLPVFSELTNSSIDTIKSGYTVSELIMIGGELSDDLSTPEYARLKMDSNNWEWESISTSIDYNQILGAATVFDTLIIVNSTSFVKRDGSTQYKLSLYDVTSFDSVTSVKANSRSKTDTQSSSSSSSNSNSTKVKAILGSVFSVAGAAMIVVGGLFFLKRRKQKQENDLRDDDYQFGNFYDQESALSDKSKHLLNDSNSTLDAASFDSWFKKRQKFDEKRSKTFRHSYLPSNETLSEHADDSEKNTISPASASNDIFIPQHVSIEPSHSIVNRSVSKLRNSFSFTNGFPSSPLLGNGDIGRLRSKKSNISTTNQKVTFSEPAMGNGEFIPEEKKSIDIGRHVDMDTIYDEVYSTSDSSVDGNVNVQVLVSSKRRSVLKVANPDSSSANVSRSTTIKDCISDSADGGILEPINAEEDYQNNLEEEKYLRECTPQETVDVPPPVPPKNTQMSELRQRVPSGEKDLDS